MSERFEDARGKIAAAFVAAPLILGGGLAANDVTAQTVNLNEIVPASEALPRGMQGGFDKASDYAETLEGIGVTIFWGDRVHSEFQKEELAGWIKGGLGTADVQSVVHFEPLQDSSAASVVFHIAGNITEPMPVAKFLENPKDPMLKAVAAFNLERALAGKAAMAAPSPIGPNGG